MGVLKKIGIGIALGVGFLVIVSHNAPKKNAPVEASKETTPQSALNSTPQPDPPPADDGLGPREIQTGHQQKAFTDIIEKYRQSFATAENDLAKGAYRQARAEEICSLLRKRSVSDWVGFLTNLSSNSDGYGVISIKVADGVEVKTWNNDLSDINDNTLIKASSPVMAAAIKMKEGQAVRFSGTFAKGDADCIGESSLTQSGSMDAPEFIMRFTALSPVEK